MAMLCKSNLERHGNGPLPPASGAPVWGVSIVDKKRNFTIIIK